FRSAASNFADSKAMLAAAAALGGRPISEVNDSFRSAASNFVDSKAMLAAAAAMCGKPIDEVNTSFASAASNFVDSKAMLAAAAACMDTKDRRAFLLILMAKRMAAKD
ncbi:MAG: hypothetical protein WC943_15205, partial [Elusimicrobiota bacterium]